MTLISYETFALQTQIVGVSWGGTNQHRDVDKLHKMLYIRHVTNNILDSVMPDMLLYLFLGP